MGDLLELPPLASPPPEPDEPQAAVKARTNTPKTAIAVRWCLFLLRRLSRYIFVTLHLVLSQSPIMETS
jgi:hypothetical protein